MISDAPESWTAGAAGRRLPPGEGGHGDHGRGCDPRGGRPDRLGTGERPTGLSCTGSAQPLLPLWIALRANVRKILEGVTLSDLATDALPEPVRQLAAGPEAWENP